VRNFRFSFVSNKVWRQLIVTIESKSKEKSSFFLEKTLFFFFQKWNFHFWNFCRRCFWFFEPLKRVPPIIGKVSILTTTFLRLGWFRPNFLQSRLGILKEELSLYCWPPVWLVWNQLHDYWQFLFLFAKQTNSNQSNRRSMVQWYLPPLVFPGLVNLFRSKPSSLE